MNKRITFAVLGLLAAGAGLIMYGISASNSPGADFARFFTDSPADRATWLVIGGIVTTAVGGAGGLMRGSKTI